MADFDEIRRKIEGASTSIAKINKDLSESNKFAGTFVKTFSDLAGMRTTGGTIWSVIDRFSGQGFYFLQKNVRGFMVIFRLAEQIESDRVKAAKEMNIQMEQQGEFLKNFLVTYDSINTIQNSTNKAFAKSVLMQQQVNRLRIREMGFADYLSNARKDAVKGISDQLEIEREMVNLQGARANLTDKSKGILGDNFKTGFFGDPEMESRVVQLLNISEEIAELDKIIPTLEGEDKKAAERQAMEKTIMSNILSKELGDRGVNARSVGGVVVSIEKSPTESFFQKMKTPDGRKTILKEIIAPSAELLKLIKRVAIFKILTKNLKLFGRIAILLLPLLGKAALAFGMLGILVYLLHQSGFIENAMEFIKSINWEETTGALMQLVTGIFDVVVGFFQLFYALFTGGSFMDEVVPAIKKIFGIDGESGGGLEGILRGVIIGVGGTLVNILLAVIGGYFAGVITALYDTYEGAKENMGKMLGFITGSVAGGVGGAKIGAAIGTAIMPGVGTVVGGVIGAGIGATIGGETGSGLGGSLYKAGSNLVSGSLSGSMGGGTPYTGLASGGTVTSGGMFLVGERGPELVNLPAGSAVFNNSQTRAMGTTINVSVNGRVGASDAELDDIARKIGRKINLEMNRYNNTGYRV